MSSTQKRYLHGYETREQERLISQAAFWRDKLIVDGTTQLDPGTRLLDIGCGVGAVLAILGEAFPGVRLYGVDISSEQIEFGQRHLASRGLEAELALADATALPYEDGSFDHVWMMWFLEHLKNPVEVLREARRVLAPGGEITCVEADYSTLKARPANARIDALFDAMRTAMAMTGASDAGPSTAGWLAEAGFSDIDPGARPAKFDGEAAIPPAAYIAEGIAGNIPAFASVPGAPSQAEFQLAVRDLLNLGDHAGAQMEWVTYKARARA